MKKTLFLSHNPEGVHLEFAKSIDAEIKIIPFKSYISLTKSYKLLSYLYPFISLIYSLFIRFKGEIIIVDGGSSLYTAVFFKKRNPKIKIIYLDGDLLFYNIITQKLNRKHNKIKLFFIMKLIKNIDASISVSKQNKEFLSQILKVPGKVVVPYPKEIKRISLKRKDYGLYVGRLDPDKKIERIINFAIQCPYFEKFIVVGDGILNKYVRRIANNNKKIFYFKKRDDVEKFYSKCKFLIHIPDSDPHPCTTMEAVICGCFPILSKGVGTKYLFDDIFIVNNPDDFNEINDKINFILNNEKKSRYLLKESFKKILSKKECLIKFKKEFNLLLNKIQNI